jgi:hypothetical protein
VYTFNPLVSDPNGDSLSLSITGRPSWAEFTGGKLFGVPGKVNLGKTFGPVTIRVQDPKGAFAVLPGFTIKVVPNREIDKFGALPGVYLLLKE